MAPDLRTFADYSVRIPGKILCPTLMKNDSWKILAAHGIDLSGVLFVASINATMFNQGMKLMLPTETLRETIETQHIVFLSFLMVPMMLWVSFFFCYFMNHGQSWGMHFLKKRWKMESKSFKHAAWFAVHSTALCVSGGLTYYLQKHVHKNFVGHDYLYDELVSIKDEKSLDLLQLIDELTDNRVEVSDQAAA